MQSISGLLRDPSKDVLENNTGSQKRFNTNNRAGGLPMKNMLMQQTMVSRDACPPCIGLSVQCRHGLKGQFNNELQVLTGICIYRYINNYINGVDKVVVKSLVCSS